MIVRRSQLFGQTFREAPAEIAGTGQAYLLRGGYVAPLAIGLWGFLPLGNLLKERLETILREELMDVGGQAIELPLTLQVLGIEDVECGKESVAALLRRVVCSYRQLPVMLFTIGEAVREGGRSRSGLLGAKAFTAVEVFDCHPTEASLEEGAQRVLRALERFFQRIELPIELVEARSTGGGAAQACMAVHPLGEGVIRCSRCAYRAQRTVARTGIGEIPAEGLLPLELVATPEAVTITALTELLGIPAARTAKAALFVTPEQRLIFAVVRGDTAVNEWKLAKVLGAKELRFAPPDLIEHAGVIVGYASPIGIRDAVVVVDELVWRSPNLVAGANRSGYHLRHTNAGRDYQPDIVADIRCADAGSPCPWCGAALEQVPAVELARLEKWGVNFGEAEGPTYLGVDGKTRAVALGVYTLDLYRVLACLAEQHCDDRGMCWPKAVAPFQIALVALDGEDDALRCRVEELAEALDGTGATIVLDDRQERAGVKFADADLFGCPIRVTVGKRGLSRGYVEVKRRQEREGQAVKVEEAVQEVQAMLGR